MKKQFKKKLFYTLSVASSLSLPLLACKCNNDEKPNKTDPNKPINNDPNNPGTNNPSKPGTGTETNELDAILDKVTIDIQEKAGMLPEYITKDNISEHALIKEAGDSKVHFINIAPETGKLIVEIQIEKDGKKSKKTKKVEINGFIELKIIKGKQPGDFTINQVNGSLFELESPDKRWELDFNSITVDRQNKTIRTEIIAKEIDPDSPPYKKLYLNKIISAKRFEGFKKSDELDYKAGVEVKLKDNKKESNFFINDVVEEDFEITVNDSSYEAEILGLQNSGEWINVVFSVSHNGESEIFSQNFTGFKKEENDKAKDICIDYNLDYSGNYGKYSIWMKTPSLFIEDPNILGSKYKTLDFYDVNSEYFIKWGPIAKIVSDDDVIIDDENGILKFEYSVYDNRLCKPLGTKRKWIMTGFCKSESKEFVVDDIHKTFNSGFDCSVNKDISKSSLPINDVKLEHITVDQGENKDVKFKVLKTYANLAGNTLYADIEALVNGKTHILKGVQVNDYQKALITAQIISLDPNALKTIKGKDGHDYKVRVLDDSLESIVLNDSGSNNLVIPDEIKKYIEYGFYIEGSDSKKSEIESIDVNQINELRWGYDMPFVNLKKLIGKNLVNIVSFNISEIKDKENFEFVLNKDIFKKCGEDTIATEFSEIDSKYNDDGLMMLGDVLLDIKDGSIDKEEYILPDYVKYIESKVFLGSFDTKFKPGITVKKINTANAVSVATQNFLYVKNLEELYLPNVEILETETIQQLKQLKKLDLGKVKTIEYSSLSGLDAVESITGKNIEIIKDNCFYDVSSSAIIDFPNLKIAESCPQAIKPDKDGWLIFGETLFAYTGEIKETLVIPDKVKVISSYAFGRTPGEIKKIEKIELNNVEIIMDNALSGLYGLQELTTKNNSIKKIGDGIVKDSNSLTKFEFDEDNIEFNEGKNWNDAFGGSGLIRH